MSQTLNQQRAFKDYKTRTMRRRNRAIRSANWLAHKLVIGALIGLLMIAAHFVYSQIPVIAEFVAYWIAK